MLPRLKSMSIKKTDLFELCTPGKYASADTTRRYLRHQKRRNRAADKIVF